MEIIVLKAKYQTSSDSICVSTYLKINHNCDAHLRKILWSIEHPLFAPLPPKKKKKIVESKILALYLHILEI